MSVRWIDQAEPGVRQFTPYQPGKSLAELERTTAVGNAIKLASNENPRGPSPQVMAAVSKALTDLNRYPDGHALTFRLAEHLGLTADRLVLGNGSNDVLDLVARVFLGPDRSAVVSAHCFLVYPIVVALAGAGLTEVAAKDYGHDLEAMRKAVDETTGVVFVANPNNPTGTWVTHEEIKHFLDELPEQVILVLDEAYCEYMDTSNYPDSMALLKEYDNLVITRTFSKVYGMASVRVGYAVANAEIADLLNRARQPFNVNGLALEAAQAALDDKDYVAESIRLNKSGLKQLEAGLSQLELAYIPTHANFLTFSLSSRRVEAADVYQAMLAQGVIVRPVANYRMPDHLRVSVGLPKENDRFLVALKKVLEGG